MLETIDFGRIETALSTRHGWVDLGLVAVCLASAWLVERRALRARGEDGAAQKNPRLHASFTRVVFPVTGLALVALASFVYRRYVGAPFFLAIAMPLLIALAAIRMLVYAMRRLFARRRWLPTSERAISFIDLGLFVLYLLGVLPEIADELDEVRIPIGKTQISLLTIGKGVLAVVFTLIVTLWLSGLIEQRLLRATHIDSEPARGAGEVRARGAARRRRADRAAGDRLRSHAADGVRRRARRRHRPRPAEARGELHRRLHDPARPVDPPRRHGHRRRPAWAGVARSRRATSSCAASTASRRSCPTRRWSPRPCSTTRTRRRDIRVGAPGAGRLRQRRRARAGADGRGARGAEPRAAGRRRTRPSRSSSTLRRERHRPRARRLDQRSGERPGQRAQRRSTARFWTAFAANGIAHCPTRSATSASSICRPGLHRQRPGCEPLPARPRRIPQGARDNRAQRLAPGKGNRHMPSGRLRVQ